MLSTDPQYAGPVILVVALAVILLICRWVFAPSSRPAAPPVGAEPVDYGLLEPVAQVRTQEDAVMLRELLREAGIRGTVAASPEGFAVLVFCSEASRARALVRS